MAAQVKRQRVLRIGIVQNQQIVQEQLIRDKGNVTVGESTKNTFVLPPSSLPKRFPLFVTKGQNYFLQFTDEMKGRVSLNGSIMSLADLRTSGQAVRRGGTWVLPVPESSRGKVAVEGVSILFQFVPAPAEPVGRGTKMDFRPKLIEKDDPVFYGFLAIFSALAVLLTVFAHTTEVAPADSIEELSERFANILIDNKEDEPREIEEQEDEREEIEVDPDASGPAVGEAEETEAVAEAVEAPPQTEITEEQRQVQEARQLQAEEQAADAMMALMLGTLGENNSGATTRDFGDQFGSGDMDAMLAGTQTMEASTSLGARSEGTGDRQAVDVGGVAQGTAGSSSIASGPEVAVDGIVGLGSAEVIAEAGEAEGVTSVVRRYKNRLKLCYDQALRKDPDLNGRVEVFFMVGRGRVVEAAIERNTTQDAELADCILRKVQALTFDPSVEAEVVYPFILSQ